MKTRAAFACLHFAVLLCGLSGLMGKAAHNPALVVTCLRSLVGALALAVVLALRRDGALAAWRGRLGPATHVRPLDYGVQRWKTERCSLSIWQSGFPTSLGSTRMAGGGASAKGAWLFHTPCRRSWQ